MILRIGKVYKYDSFLIYIASKRRFNKRVIYTIQRVNSSGVLGPKSEKIFKRGECKLVKNCKAIIYIKLPDGIKNRARFENLVERARKLAKKKPHNFKIEMAKLAICCSEFEHATEGRQCNLRDFARAVKFKSFNTLYRWVLDYYSMFYTDRKYNVAIPSAADSTIIKTINTHQRTFSSYYGFNKKLDQLLTKNARAYMAEFNLRGLSLE